jgi:hypothetical protein
MANVTAKAVVAILYCVLRASPAASQVPARPDTPVTPSIADKTASAQKLAGYFNLYWDAKQGKLWLEIDQWNSEFLYQSGLSAGVGSNDIGLDRGQLGATRIVRFERIGPKVLLIEENLNYRAVSSDADERRAVHDSFAESTLWGFAVAAETADHALVDATDFFLRDAHNVSSTLRRTKQGAYKLDDKRSAIYLPNTKAFPRNTEVEATLGCAALRRLLTRSLSASIIPSCTCPGRDTSRGFSIRAPGTLQSTTWTMRPRSASRL